MSATPEFSVVIEIEQEVIGSLMIGTEAREALSFLRDEHFIEPVHSEIFRAIRSAYDRFGIANPVVVKQLLQPSSVTAFEKATGKTISQYLASMATNTSVAGRRAVEYARNVVEQWARAAIAKEAFRAGEAANDPAADISAIVHDTAHRLDDIMSEVRSGRHRRGSVSIGTAAGEAVNAAMEAKDSGSGLTGVTWGLADINRLTGGIQRRDLTIIGARPGMGKTSIGLSVALKAARSGAGAVFFSLEMDAGKLGARAISDVLYDWNQRVPYMDTIRGQLSEEQVDAIAEAQVQIDRLPIFIDDRSGPTITDIRVRTERLMDDARKSGADLAVVFIDHLGLIRPSSRYQGNRTNEIGEITSGLKAMARELNVGVVLLSQLNRSVESRAEKVPQLSDLRDSGSIEQDADMIAFLYREAYYLARESGGTLDEQAERSEKLIECQNKLEFHIAKQRNGPVTKIDLFADMAFSAVRNGVSHDQR